MANDRSSANRDNNDIQDINKDRNPTEPTDDTNRPSCSEGSNAEQHNSNTKKEESSFSFKHFLRTSGEAGVSSSNGGSTGVSNNVAAKTGLRTMSSLSGPSPCSSSTQPNLGARPKVPQFSMGHNGIDQHALPRMKRSPKFPSFDSHASLAEYSEDVSPNFVQRSHSNYEVETPALFSSSRRSPSITSQRGEPALCGSPGGHSTGSGRTNTEFQAGLPDFVKDHFYQSNPFRGSAADPNDLSSGPSLLQPSNGDADSELLNPRPYHNSNLFDLTLGAGGSASSSSSFRLASNSPTIPLDLPTYDLGNGSERIQIPLDLPHHGRFGGDRLPNPSNNAMGDLPLDLTERHRVNSRNDNHMPGQRLRDGNDSPPPPMQADMIQTLPDFLSDGPIHSSGRMADVAQDLPQLDSPEENAASNVISRLRLENDRLRHELDEARRLISDQGRQISDLERTCRSGEIQRNGTVLERNKLNQKIAQLTEENRTLQVENESLRDGGAVGGNSSDKEQRRPSQRMCQLLSMELKLAAGSAEANLRQLLAGVENLKALARRVEDGMEDHTDSMGDYNSEEDDDDDEDFLASAGASGL